MVQSPGKKRNLPLGRKRRVLLFLERRAAIYFLKKIVMLDQFIIYTRTLPPTGRMTPPQGAATGPLVLWMGMMMMKMRKEVATRIVSMRQ
eukprot:scaffold22833_cov163-Skeletonema_dohrnii-CCMP3373.AAC.1